MAFEIFTKESNWAELRRMFELLASYDPKYKYAISTLSAGDIRTFARVNGIKASVRAIPRMNGYKVVITDLDQARRRLRIGYNSGVDDVNQSERGD